MATRPLDVLKGQLSNRTWEMPRFSAIVILNFAVPQIKPVALREFDKALND
jgi:hypothetical protein